MSVIFSKSCSGFRANTNDPKPYYMVCLLPPSPESFPATLPSDSQLQTYRLTCHSSYTPRKVPLLGLCLCNPPPSDIHEYCLHSSLCSNVTSSERASLTTQSKFHHTLSFSLCLIFFIAALCS